MVVDVRTRLAECLVELIRKAGLVLRVFYFATLALTAIFFRGRTPFQSDTPSRRGDTRRRVKIARTRATIPRSSAFLRL